MGHLQDRHGMSMLGHTPPGTCPECAVAHAPEQPHNQQSLAYQYHFYDQHGRWPTWADAMAHCPPEVKELWIRELKARGIEIEAAPETGELTIEISAGEEERK